jgi:hypothetical protein
MPVEIAGAAGSAVAEERDLGRDGHMEANPHTGVDFQSRAALGVWCLLAALALAPMPILHAYPIGFLYYLFESHTPGWTRFTLNEAFWFSLIGLPLAPIFLAWALPGASRPGVPMRSIVVLFILVPYDPFRHFFESYFYGDGVARISNVFSWSESPLLWAIWRLDTPLLIGLGATALLRHHTLRPFWKILFHWGLFVCAIWAAGPLYDNVLHEGVFWSGFRR